MTTRLQTLDWLINQTVEWKHPECKYIFVHHKLGEPTHYRYTNNWQGLSTIPEIVLISKESFFNRLRERVV